MVATSAAGELAGHRSRTRGAIVEAANDGNAFPGMVAGGWQADDSQHEPHGQRRFGAGDRAQNAGLGLALGKALARETETRGSQEREEEADGGGQNPRPRLEPLDAGEELRAILLERFERDHGSLAAPLPTGDGRARNVQAVAQRPSTGAMHMLPEAVVVRAAVLRGRRERWCHRGSIAKRGFKASGRRSESSVISTLPQLRTRLFGMFWSTAGMISKVPDSLCPADPGNERPRFVQHCNSIAQIADQSGQ